MAKKTRGEPTKADSHINKVISRLCVGGAVASWLVRSSPDRVVRFRALAGDIVLCSWARHFTVPLSTRLYKWVPARESWIHVHVQNAYFCCECFSDREKQQRRLSIPMLGMVRGIRRFISRPSEDTKRSQTFYYGGELRQMPRITLRWEHLCILLVNLIIQGYVRRVNMQSYIMISDGLRS